MPKKIWIAPSLLSADFGKLAAEIQDVEKAGCDCIHVDVMDGHFVPNLTIGPVVVKGIRKSTQLPLDVHLMISDPAKYIPEFIKAGSDWITFHVEATKNVSELIAIIKKSGKKAGLSLRPGTPIESLQAYIKDLDLVLVMSVEPGFGGQSFMANMMPKIGALRKMGFKGMISVDGGIDPLTAKQALEQGADILVAGSAIFAKPDRAQAVRDFRKTTAAFEA